MYSRSNNELRKEAANIGSSGASLNNLRPYNHAGRYGCEYFFLYGEIPHDGYYSEHHEFIPKKEMPTSNVQNNFFHRLKKSVSFFKRDKLGGDGSGGGKALSGSCGIGGSIGGASDVDLKSIDSLLKNNSLNISKSVKTGGDMGGGGLKDNNL